MSSQEDGSVTGWIGDLRVGGDSAAQHLWERYFHRLVHLARARFHSARRTGIIEDEEDVALGALDSFCRGVALGRYPQLDNREDLWRLLVVITIRKVRRPVRAPGGPEARRRPAPRRVGPGCGRRGRSRWPRSDRRGRAHPRAGRDGRRRVSSAEGLLAERLAAPGARPAAGGLHAGRDRRTPRLRRADGEAQTRTHPRGMVGGGILMDGSASSSAEGRSIRPSERIDEACDRFEAAWRDGSPPQIEDYLAEALEADRPALLGRARGAGAGAATPSRRAAGDRGVSVTLRR